LWLNLRDVPKPPDRLYVQGRTESLTLLRKLPSRALAVVGTREPTARSLRWVEGLVLSLRGTDIVVISGFARGIDAAAHYASIRAGLPTIAVLGTPLEKAYPRENSKLRQALLESGGLLVSEFPAGGRVFPSHFTHRNRLI